MPAINMKHVQQQCNVIEYCVCVCVCVCLYRPNTISIISIMKN